MKKEIYDVMENVIGWRLDGNFDDVAQMNKNVLERNWARLDNAFDMKSRVMPLFTSEELETLKDAIGFVIDFMDAVAIIDNSKELENK